MSNLGIRVLIRGQSFNWVFYDWGLRFRNLELYGGRRAGVRGNGNSGV